MTSKLGMPTMLSIATGALYQVTGTLVDWEGPSKTAFEREMQRLIKDLEAADMAMTLTAMAEIVLVAAA